MRWKSTQNIFKDFGEVFESKWMDSNKLVTPPNPPWDYSRELQVEDVDVGEVLWEAGGGWGVYAAWCPYAEFYMLCVGVNMSTVSNVKIETFYGPMAQKKLLARTKELNINLNLTEKWVDDEELWLFQEPEITPKIFLL